MKNRSNFWWLAFLCVAALHLGCELDAKKSQHLPVPQLSPEAPVKLDFAGALEHLGALKKSLAAADKAHSLKLIDDLAKSLSISFPLELTDAPFSFHSFYDLLMKNTRAIRRQNQPSVMSSWQAFIDGIQGKIVYRYHFLFPMQTSLLAGVLKGVEPSFKIELRKDFLTFSPKDYEERDNISLESFWQPAFLYSSKSGHTAEEDTGAVIAIHDGTIVAILEFKNELASLKPIDLHSQNDLRSVVATTRGYVSSVGRLAAYARFDLGKKMFAEFFAYAQAHKFAESYLHVRQDNSSAIALYKSVDYTIVATIPEYYPGNPPVAAYVMRKVF